jgi:hypothetical protein
MMTKMKIANYALKLTPVRVCIMLLPMLSPGYGAETKPSQEQGQFGIFVAGKEIGKEKFSIQSSGDSISSNSTTSFRDPNKKQNAKKETELVMNSQFVPRTYMFRTETEGQRGMMKGTFSQGEAKFEYEAGGTTGRSGLLVGDRYTVLDTNVFHHFIFIARLYDFSSKEQSQSMEVVIPQELENGLLKISNWGSETTDMRGKKRELHHLKVDSGSVQIDLWVDDQHVLYKIALPARSIEVIRE